MGIRIESLAIPLIASPSSWLGFEGDFTRVIREEFVSHSKVPLVPREQAGAVLIGTVYEVKTEPVNYRLVQNAYEGHVTTYEVTNTRRLKIKLHAKLIDRATGIPIWKDEVMEEKADFQVGDDPLINRYNQRRAVREMARRLAKKIYLKTMDRF